jgi:dGTPase
LNEAYSEGFLHAEQSLRVVDKLESTRKGPGLNLTFEVRDGILLHSKGKDLLSGRTGERAATLEGQVVSICDGIAYISHDIDDALRAGIIVPGDLPQDAIAVLGKTTSERIDTMAVGLIEGSCEGFVDMKPEVSEATNALRTFLYANVYPCEEINIEISKAKRLFRELYDYLIGHPAVEIGHLDPRDPIERRVVDFLASMTDQYALSLYAKLFFPTGWQP